jgi:hypothetical protein
MEQVLSDLEIQYLIREKKFLTVAPEDFFRGMREKRGHKETDHILHRSDGSSFILKIRVSNENILDFSVILGFSPADSNKIFLLRRYNGKSHEHKNTLEGESPFYDFHIHTATERYQRIGAKEEFYAVPTDRYTTMQEALNCLVTDCNIEIPVNPQLQLDI